MVSQKVSGWAAIAAEFAWLASYPLALLLVVGLRYFRHVPWF